MGSELALAFDMRFASREKAVFGQIEVPTGLMPGGGGLERLPLLVGRARAIEAIICGHDFTAGLAERYGWINRALAADQFPCRGEPRDWLVALRQSAGGLARERAALQPAVDLLGEFLQE